MPSKADQDRAMREQKAAGRKPAPRETTQAPSETMTAPIEPGGETPQPKKRVKRAGHGLPVQTELPPIREPDGEGPTMRLAQWTPLLSIAASERGAWVQIKTYANRRAATAAANRLRHALAAGRVPDLPAGRYEIGARRGALWARDADGELATTSAIPGGRG